MKLIFTGISLFLLIVSCGHQTKKNGSDTSGSPTASGKAWFITSTDDWVKNEGLINAESIIYDRGNRVFYVTNGIDYKPGDQGFISKLSENGDLQELKWVAGLNRPTGMAIRDSILYVADVNALVSINTRNGKIIEKYSEPIANSGLNDVSINEKGEVYVSASFIHAVLKLSNDSLELWAKEDEKLKWANGLIADNKQILVAGLTFNAINIDSKQITEIELSPPIKDFDGITSDDLGGYFLTTVENSRLFHLNEQKYMNQLMEGDAYFGDLEFDQSKKRIYIPRGNKKTGEFFITVLTVAQK